MKFSFSIFFLYTLFVIPSVSSHQTDVILWAPCSEERFGSGCHLKFTQLSSMKEIGDGWRKVKVKSEMLIYNNEKRKYEYREFGRSTTPWYKGLQYDYAHLFWNYSNCRNNMFTKRFKEYSSPPPPPRDWEGEINVIAHQSDKSLLSYTLNDENFHHWYAMCSSKQSKSIKDTYNNLTRRDIYFMD